MRRLIALLGVFMLVSPIGGMAFADNFPTSFWWNIDRMRGRPEGWRYWSVQADGTWLEVYDKTKDRSFVVGDYSLYGCDGKLLFKEDKLIETFIPNRHCPIQDLMARPFGSKQRWQFIGRIQNTTYEQIQSNMTARPKKIEQGPESKIIDRILESELHRPTGRRERAIASIEAWAYFDALLSHCNEGLNFEEKAEASAKHCSQSSQLQEAISLFKKTKKLLSLHMKFRSYQCDSMDNVPKIARKRLTSALASIEKTCG